MPGPLFKSVRGFTPEIHEKAFVAETASIIGQVKIGEGSSIWFGCVLRGDVMPIEIGNEVNVQDNSVLHGTMNKVGVKIADRTTIGHGVILHGCDIGFECLIGMGSIIMDGAQIPDQCIVGAGSLVSQGAKFEPRSLIMGRPAKKIRDLKPEEIAFLSQSAENYKVYQTWYQP